VVKLASSLNWLDKHQLNTPSSNGIAFIKLIQQAIIKPVKCVFDICLMNYAIAMYTLELL